MALSQDKQESTKSPRQYAGDEQEDEPSWLSVWVSSRLTNHSYTLSFLPALPFTTVSALD